MLPIRSVSALIRVKNAAKIVLKMPRDVKPHLAKKSVAFPKKISDGCSTRIGFIIEICAANTFDYIQGKIDHFWSSETNPISLLLFEEFPKAFRGISIGVRKEKLGNETEIHNSLASA